MKAIISLAARMKSTRLPGKVMSDIDGRPMLALIIERLRGVRGAEVVLSNNDGDPELERLAAEMDVEYVGGDRCDVTRIHGRAMWQTGAEIVCFAGADDPFLPTDLFEEAIERVGRGDVAFVKSAGWPLGMNVWAVTRDAMYAADGRATEPDERQHVVPYWERRPHAYPVAVIHRPGPNLYNRFRVTVDSQSDLNMVRLVYSALGPNPPSEDVIAFLDRHPEIAAVNADGLHGTAARDAIYSVAPIDERVPA